MVVKGLSDAHGGLAFIREIYRCTITDAVYILQKHIAGEPLQVHIHYTLIIRHHYSH